MGLKKRSHLAAGGPQIAFLQNEANVVPIPMRHFYKTKPILSKRRGFRELSGILAIQKNKPIWEPGWPCGSGHER